MNRSSWKAAFSLIEVTLAIGVAAIALLSIFALLPIGLRTNSEAINQSKGGDVASAVLADIRATPRTTPPGRTATSTRFSIGIPSNPVTSQPPPSTLYFTDDGVSSATATTESRYRVVIAFLPNNVGGRAATLARITVSWPASASPTSPQGVVEAFSAFDRN